ncbi:hypothetical protein BT96DRAFT_947871 [Gymnopus androsaceus JB14]|uniref:Uncharacterized protein n=1 Tax=Gymnopus androsaceus JB14 TaxID=1447944 RepID=A0A6A4GS94_9AGAR|nr:hypothetical protein BT96DRAFT_947871 [Gymnopus androsaceus JB14]
MQVLLGFFRQLGSSRKHNLNALGRNQMWDIACGHNIREQALQAAGGIVGWEPRRGEVETGLPKALSDPGIIGRGDQEEGGIRGNQYHTQWLPYSIPTQTAFQPPTQSPQNLAPPAIPPNTQGVPPPVQLQGPANTPYVYRPPAPPPAPFIQAPNQLNWNWNYAGGQGHNANMGGGPPNPGRPGGPPSGWGGPPGGPYGGPPPGPPENILYHLC